MQRHSVRTVFKNRGALVDLAVLTEVAGGQEES